MALATALVLLSENDPEAPALPGLASVSKDDDFDDGAFDVGAEAASRGAVWSDRPYVTGNPSVDWMLERIDRAVGAGAASVQVLNECNLELEGFQGGPQAYASYYAECRAARPDAVLLYQPPSPGVPGWQEWVDRTAPAFGVHAYGSYTAMRDIVRWYVDNTAGELWITELNPGAGNSFDLTAWAHGELDPFLAWCSGQPRIRMAAYFSWKWDQSPSLPSSVDACDCPAVVEVLKKYATSPVPPEPPEPEEPTMPDIVLSVPTKVALASPSNYQTGPRAATIGVVVHTSRGNASSLAAEYNATVNWFANPAAQVSAHLVVGPEEVARCVHDQDIAWHARTANAAFLGIEIAQPTISTPITDGQYRAAAEACRKWSETYGFPLERSMTIRRPGLVGHEDSEPGRADGKTDPGTPPSGVFDWERFLALCRDGTVPPTTDPTALQEQVWALADQLMLLGAHYEEAGYPHRAEYVRSQGNAIKEWVNTASKLQP